MLARFVLIFILNFLSGCSTDSHTKPVSSGYVQVEGGKLYYQIFGKGEPIIIVHGGPAIGQTYLQPQFFELAKDYQVIFYDQRGSGKSLDVLVDPKVITPKKFAEDLEELRKSLGLKQVTLIGHSWGGFLSMQYALLYPQHVKKLIIANSYPADLKGANAFMKELTKRIKNIQDKIKPIFSYDEFSKLNLRQIDSLYRNIFSVHFYNSKKEKELNIKIDSLRSAQSGFKVRELMDKDSQVHPEEWNILSQLHKISVPTLVISAKGDIIPYWTSEEIKNNIPGSHFLLFGEDCDHFPYIEKQEVFFDVIRGFLSDFKQAV